MTLFGKNVLFSEITGKVILDGKPVEKAEIIQKVLIDHNNSITNSMTTSSDGIFHFPQIERNKRIIDFLPAQFAIGQEILIHFDEKEITGWIYTKSDPEPNSEASGNKFELLCDLGAEPSYSDNYYGVCRLIKS